MGDAATHAGLPLEHSECRIQAASGPLLGKGEPLSSMYWGACHSRTHAAGVCHTTALLVHTAVTAKPHERAKCHRGFHDGKLRNTKCSKEATGKKLCPSRQKQNPTHTISLRSTVHMSGNPTCPSLCSVLKSSLQNHLRQPFAPNRQCTKTHPHHTTIHKPCLPQPSNPRTFACCHPSQRQAVSQCLSSPPNVANTALQSGWGTAMPDCGGVALKRTPPSQKQHFACRLQVHINTVRLSIARRCCCTPTVAPAPAPAPVSTPASSAPAEIPWADVLTKHIRQRLQLVHRHLTRCCIGGKVCCCCCCWVVHRQCTPQISPCLRASVLSSSCCHRTARWCCIVQHTQECLWTYSSWRHGSRSIKSLRSK